MTPIRLRFRRNRRCKLATRSHDDNGSGAIAQQKTFVGTHFGDHCRRGLVRDHDGKWLRVASLALPQSSDGVIVARIAKEVKAADAFERDNISRADRFDDISDFMAETRAATGTGNRLGVEAAIFGIMIVASAIRTHCEARHRRLRPVVRQSAGDRETRPTMRAAQEWIEMETARWIEKIIKTGFANGGVDDHARAALATDAREN